MPESFIRYIWDLSGGCTDDNSCPCNQKCCSNGCGHVCTNPPVPKAGFCPASLSFPSCFFRWWSFGSQSTSDGDCSGTSKCCTVCWGRQCVTPSKTGPKPKAGTCPVIDKTVVRCMNPGTSQDGCHSDDQCSGAEKCCDTACCGLQCGKANVETLPSSQCPYVNKNVACLVKGQELCGQSKPCASGTTCCPAICPGGTQCVTRLCPVVKANSACGSTVTKGCGQSGADDCTAGNICCADGCGNTKCV